MHADELFERYRELQSYVSWEATDVRRIQALQPILAPHFGELIDDFYAEIERHPEALKVITGGVGQIDRLKGSLRAWLGDLFGGQYDAAYVSRRWRVGWRHAEIRLDQVYTNVAMSRLRTGLNRCLQDEWHGPADERNAIAGSLNKLLDLDLAIIEDAYQQEHLARELTHAQEQARLAERLAGIGQMLAGLAHESGNALARSQACLDMLAQEVGDDPEAKELIASIQDAQRDLRQLYDDVRGFAGQLKLERDDWDLSGIWRQAWQNLAMARRGRQAELGEETAGLDLTCSVDHFRLEQVFRNIFDNALAACRDPVNLTVTCADTALEGRSALRVAIRDNGPGLCAEQRRRIFEPFFTTKSKGTGLGMAIARRIIEAHGGTIELGDNPGGGAEIVLAIPRTYQAD